MADFVIFHSRIPKCGCANCVIDADLQIDVTCVFMRDRMKDSARCQFSWTSPCLMDLIDQVVLNAKVLNTGQENCNRMVAATFQSTIQLWSVMVNNDGSLVTREISQSVRKVCHEKKALERIMSLS